MYHSLKQMSQGKRSRGLINSEAEEGDKHRVFIQTVLSITYTAFMKTHSVGCFSIVPLHMVYLTVLSLLESFLVSTTQAQIIGTYSRIAQLFYSMKHILFLLVLVGKRKVAHILIGIRERFFTQQHIKNSNLQPQQVSLTAYVLIHKLLCAYEMLCLCS